MTAQNATRAPRAARGCPLRQLIKDNPGVVPKSKLQLAAMHRVAKTVSTRRMLPCCKH